MTNNRKDHRIRLRDKITPRTSATLESTTIDYAGNGVSGVGGYAGFSVIGSTIAHSEGAGIYVVEGAPPVVTGTRSRALVARRWRSFRGISMRRSCLGTRGPATMAGCVSSARSSTAARSRSLGWFPKSACRGAEKTCGSPRARPSRSLPARSGREGRSTGAACEVIALYKKCIGAAVTATQKTVGFPFSNDPAGIVGAAGDFLSTSENLVLSTVGDTLGAVGEIAGAVKGILAVNQAYNTCF